MSATVRCALGALLLCLCTTARGQAEERAGGEAAGYNPMFTPQMIARATPEQARRMREAEARNRQAWESRQAALRASRNAGRAEGGAVATDAAEAAPAPRRTGQRRIYRWRDEYGNVSFGDAPTGNDAEEVKVGGVARGPGRPLSPTTSETGEER
jgi:hypothetical protein